MQRPSSRGTGRGRLLRSATFCLLAFATFDAARAITVTEFQGSREAVRGACADHRGELVEASLYSACLAPALTITCYDDGDCVRTGPGAQLSLREPQGTGVPESLVGGDAGEDHEAAPPATPAPPIG